MVAAIYTVHMLIHRGYEGLHVLYVQKKAFIYFVLLFFV